MSSNLTPRILKVVIMIEKKNIDEWLKLLGDVKEGSKNYGLSQRLYKIAKLPRRKRVSVNLRKLNEHALDSNVIVPGKVLGSGELTGKFSIAALEYSDEAEKKLNEAGCQIIKLGEMIKKDSVKIIV